jgi:hypothetical protein
MFVCVPCGYENQIGATFCSSCGARLKDEVGEDVTASYEPVDDEEGDAFSAEELPDGTLAMLVVLKGPKKGTRIALDGREITIGRDSESDIFLDDITVSRSHAKIFMDGEDFKVGDSGSLNGTYVNRNLVDGATLTNGDELQIGKFKLVFNTVYS